MPTEEQLNARLAGAGLNYTGQQAVKAGVQLPSTITSATLDNSGSAITVPPPPIPKAPDSTGGQAIIDAFGDTEAVKAPKGDFEAFLKELTSSPEFTAKEEAFNIDQRSLVQAQSAEKAARARYAGVNAELQAFIDRAQQIPIQAQKDVTGRGVTAAGLAPITTAQLRENALAAIPYQAKALAAQAEVLTAQAAVAEARGNAQLSQSILEQAQQRMDKIFEAHRLDAQIEYDYKKEVRQRVYDRLDNEEKRRLDAIQKESDREFDLLKIRINSKDDYVKAAIASGQGELAGRIALLDPKSATFDTSLASMAGLIKPEADVQFISGTEYQQAGYFDKSTRKFTPIGGEKLSSGSVTVDSGLGSIANLLTSKFGSKFQQTAFTNTVNSLAQSGNEQGLADFIFSSAIDTISDTDARKKAISQYKITRKLTSLQEQLDAYKAAGGKTNIFRGTKENILARVGTLSDPTLRALGIQLQDTLDALARDRTGAVITESEEKFYNRLLPGTYKTAELNEATINGLKASLVTDLDSALRYQLTGSGFDSIEPYLNAQRGVSGTQSLQNIGVSKSDEDLFDSVVGTGGTASRGFGGFFSDILKGLTGQ